MVDNITIGIKYFYYSCKTCTISISVGCIPAPVVTFPEATSNATKTGKDICIKFTIAFIISTPACTAVLKLTKSIDIKTI